MTLGNNSIKYKMCLDFYTRFILNSSHSERNSARYCYECTYCINLHVKYPIFWSDFNYTWNFSTYFWKTFKYQILWKSVQWEQSCSMRTDRHDEANIRFSQFYEHP